MPKDKQKTDRPSLGSGGAEQAAKSIEGHKQQRRQMLAQALGKSGNGKKKDK